MKTTEAQVHAEILRLIARALPAPDPKRAAEILNDAANDLEQIK